jgi:hypothetical protein
MKKTQIGRGLIFLLLVSICFLGFKSYQKIDTAKSNISQLINSGDMQQGRHYLFWDHGSAVSVVKFDRTDGDMIYTTFSITPSQSLFSRNAPFTLDEAGDIQPASGQEIAHLRRSINAGRYVP